MKSQTTIYSGWVSDFPGKTPRHTTISCGWGIITMLKDKIVKLPYLAYNERFVDYPTSGVFVACWACLDG